MQSVNSLSGGTTSSYLAAKFPADHNLFALVTTSDLKQMYPDAKLRQVVSDKIGREFIGTLEDDKIIHTMLDLEQFLGQKINWVAGIPFDEVVSTKGGYLPNKLHRYCTTYLKIEPMFYWWMQNIGEPVDMRIGYRANEVNRKNKAVKKHNSNGYLSFKAIVGNRWTDEQLIALNQKRETRGQQPRANQNKWKEVEWQRQSFPLLDQDPTFKLDIINYWKDKPIRFAPRNNCVGCFHRNPMILKKMFEFHPTKMDWFNIQEQEKQKNGSKGTWRSDFTYEQIRNTKLQLEFNYDDWSECDWGFCEID